MKNGTNSCSSVNNQTTCGRKTAKAAVTLPSGGCFFIAVRVFVGFPNDNGHRVLPHMKRNTQRPIPPFGSGSRNSRQLPFFTTSCEALIFYGFFILCQGFSMGCASTPCARQISSTSSWLSIRFILIRFEIIQGNGWCGLVRKK